MGMCKRVCGQKIEKGNPLPEMEVNAGEAEPRNCDRDICYRNEVNGIGCDECEVAKSCNLEDDDSPCLNCGVEE